MSKLEASSTHIITLAQPLLQHLRKTAVRVSILLLCVKLYRWPEESFREAQSDRALCFLISVINLRHLVKIEVGTKSRSELSSPKADFTSCLSLLQSSN